jgi:hypothetical protein
MKQLIGEEYYFDVDDELHDVMKQYYDVLLKIDIENLFLKKFFFIFLDKQEE